MLSRILREAEFSNILSAHAENVVNYLIEESVEFGILCNLNEVEFEPALPTDIAKGLKPLTLFMLAGFTLESSYITSEDKMLFFEAGFGAENFGSLVSVPLSSIIQIAIEDTVVFINLAASIPKQKKKTKQKAEDTSKSTGNEDRSLKNFLSNPENKKFLK